ncbi:hypothetical protein EGW08_003343, partial [Elysia chlorotica]
MANHDRNGRGVKLSCHGPSVMPVTYQLKPRAVGSVWLFRFLLTSILLLRWADCQSQHLTPTLSPQCYRSTNITGACIPVNDSGLERMCLGAKIPFTHTSLALAHDSNSLKEVQDRLHLWTGLQNVPQCWAIVQPFLCSVYLPKCTESLGVMLPSKQLCERTRKPCQIVHDINNGWPDFLKCDHPNFVSGCGPENYDYVSFNTTGKCEPPLVRTLNPHSWYHGVEGCGMPCDNPLFSKDDHKEAHTFVAVFGSICLICTLFTVMTFIIDWKNANRYPALIIFFINACFFLGSVGWMAQFAGDARTEIVCRKDGTARRGEPQLGSDESVWCPVIFTLVYYFFVAGICWYVMLAYAWCLTFTALGGSTARGRDPGATPQEVLRSRTAYFHIISWCSPLVLTIVCLAVSEIDGDSLSGICFVGAHNSGVRAMFVLLPVGLVIVVGTFFLIKGVYTLTKIRNDAPAFIPEKTFSKIRATIIRLGIFTAVALCFVFITFAVHIYIFTNEDKWNSSFRQQMLVFHKPSTKPVKLKRHRMIAQMFEKRKEINQGRMSISYRSSHDDPLGMKFDFNSGSDDELSSNFAIAMPQLVRRRGGVIFPMSSAGRRYSDSDVTSVISTRRVSRESLVEFRDAQYVIVDRDGLPAYALPEPGSRRGDRSKRKKVMKTRKQRKRNNKLNRMKPTSGPMFTGSRFGSTGKSSSRKGSDSSVLSQLSAASMRFFKFRRRRNSPDSESVNSIIPVSAAEDHRTNMASLNSSSLQPRPRLEFGPAKPKADYRIFSSKKSRKDPDIEMGGLGETASLIGRKGADRLEVVNLDETRLSGIADELGSKSSQSLSKRKQKHQEKEFQTAAGLAGSSRNKASSQQRSQHTSATPAAKQQRVQQLRTVTVETHQQELLHQRQQNGAMNSSSSLANGVPPLHALMADISCGNWGVLLGKNGSSSSSEAGGLSGYNRNRLSQVVAPTPPAPANPSFFSGGGVSPYPMAAGRIPYIGATPPAPPQPALGDAAHHPQHHLGPPGMSFTGPRPKAPGTWGLLHEPCPPSTHREPHQGLGRGRRSFDRRILRERQKEREMRRPNQNIFNSTFDPEDEEIDSVSV